MTKQELYAIWQRWVHRNDLTADLDEIYRQADQTIHDRVLQPVTTGEILETYPNLFVHAGLVKLHTLAQDDEGMMREGQLLADAFTTWHMRYSQTRSPGPRTPWELPNGT